MRPPDSDHSARAVEESFEELRVSGRLPSPCGVGMRVLELARDPNTSIDEIASTVQADGGLTGRILQFANSARFGTRSPARNASEAAMRLGTREVMNLALGFSLVTGNRSGDCRAFDFDRYWSWAIASAAAARALARSVGYRSPGDAFTLGLLQRIGRLALASVHPEAYAEILESSAALNTTDLSRAEHERFRIDHLRVAAALFADWGLPVVHGEAVLCAGGCTDGTDDADLPLDAEARVLTRILAEAASMADTIVTSAAPESSHQDLAPGVMEEARLAWEEWCGAFGFQTAVPEPLDGEDPCPSSAGGLRVLAVEDDAVSLEILKKTLESAGHTVHTASDGKEALAIALRWQPQIVVTDWMMPGMDGLELCADLRRYEEGQRMYVLLLTGQDQEGRIVEAFEAGVDDFVAKPFRPRLLLARIRAGQRVVQLQDQVAAEQATQRRQVSELGVMTRKLESAALTDSLTGLPNRRHAMERMEMAWASAERSGQSLAVIALDIDRFKRINDTLGHDAGDRVLCAASRAIEASLRRGDTCARFGGEEFLILCPNTDLEGAHALAERVRASIADALAHVAGGVTASLGVAVRGNETADGADLLKAADRAVYGAKRTGRNRVVVDRPQAA